MLGKRNSLLMDSKLRYWLGKEGGLAVNVLAYGFGFVVCLFLFNGGYASRLEIPNLLSFFFQTIKVRSLFARK